MKTKEVTCVKCGKETEIQTTHDKVLKMEDKVNSIHKALVGNGQPGMIAEFNQAKGTLKFLKFAFGGGWLLTMAILIAQQLFS